MLTKSWNSAVGGCYITEEAGGAGESAMKVCGRDTGAVAIAIFVPVFVKGQRYGSATAAWKIDS